MTTVFLGFYWEFAETVRSKTGPGHGWWQSSFGNRFTRFTTEWNLSLTHRWSVHDAAWIRRSALAQGRMHETRDTRIQTRNFHEGKKSNIYYHYCRRRFRRRRRCRHCCCYCRFKQTKSNANWSLLPRPWREKTCTPRSLYIDIINTSDGRTIE